MAVTDLQTLIDSLASATAVLAQDSDAFLPPQDGISMLDLKNDLLLSYLQNLAFLILFKLRNGGTKLETEEDDGYKTVVEKLIELRVYLERGVRPIEQRLKYTIDQYLQAAHNQKQVRPARTSSGHVRDPDASEDSDSDSDVRGNPAFDPTSTADEASQAPGLASLATSLQKSTTADKPSKSASSNGIYKPPRINPTAMPSLDPDARPAANRKRTSALMNEYIDDELSSAPRAQPSIGSNNTIVDRGRGGVSQRDLEKQRERTEYEERNFTRLPGESKAEKRKARKRGEGERRDMFGGEDWTGLGGLGDRIGRSVTGGEKEGKLKRREKRRATEDAPRGDGLQIGDSFEKRRKVLAGRADRRSGKRR
ncbi:uncharacterized protein HMPREF1541_10728 [Cyphellophora europaea CBS 101466]|uniref:Uncharacterized protein n=1 Tax=Cyphellophora europaea (strain CBS 101466) TaxID=1220924 RepID=W2S805_CYPE1|nr:uncharacterized protein HMPREF1541_10728 [Cyphellophora europaea CBS 101466]ETN44178.1 hypothetical protein HMPREF1541_10728 [Cyphellophora europaea CBS 101466]